MGRLADAAATVLAIARAVDDYEIEYPAASIAYYAFVSVLPVLVLVLAVVGESLAARLQAVTPRLLAPEAQRLVYESMTTAAGRTGASVFAALALAWSSVNVFRGFETVLERVEGTVPDRPAARARDGAAVVGSLVLAVAAVLATSVLVAVGPTGPRFVAAGFLVLVVALTAAFLPLYYVPSRLVTALTAALPGALTAAVGWTVLLTVIQFFAANAGRYAVYGVLSGILLILTSFYLAAFVLLIGFVVNATFVGDGAAPAR